MPNISSISRYFTDRQVQHPGRITLTDVQFGNQNTYDVDRAEGTITQDGTPFSADAFNRIADDMLDVGQINADLIAAELTKTLGPASAYCSGNIKYDKIGSLVIVYVDVVTTATYSATFSQQLSFNQMESGYIPGTTQSAIIRNLNDPLLRVSTSGLLSVYAPTEAIPTGTAIKGEVCYYV